MVAIENPKNCPSCGSTNFDFVRPASGTSYVLTTVDQTQNPPAFHATNGIPVSLYGCLDCGVGTLHIPSLRKK